MCSAVGQHNTVIWELLKKTAVTQTHPPCIANHPSSSECRAALFTSLTKSLRCPALSRSLHSLCLKEDPQRGDTHARTPYRLLSQYQIISPIVSARSSMSWAKHEMSWTDVYPSCLSTPQQHQTVTKLWTASELWQANQITHICFYSSHPTRCHFKFLYQQCWSGRKTTSKHVATCSRQTRESPNDPCSRRRQQNEPQKCKTQKGRDRLLELRESGCWHGLSYWVVTACEYWLGVKISRGCLTAAICIKEESSVECFSAESPTGLEWLANSCHALFCTASSHKGLCHDKPVRRNTTGTQKINHKCQLCWQEMWSLEAQRVKTPGKGTNRQHHEMKVNSDWGKPWSYADN